MNACNEYCRADKKLVVDYSTWLNVEQAQSSHIIEQTTSNPASTGEKDKTRSNSKKNRRNKSKSSSKADQNNGAASATASKHSGENLRGKAVATKPKHFVVESDVDEANDSDEAPDSIRISNGLVPDVESVNRTTNGNHSQSSCNPTSRSNDSIVQSQVSKQKLEMISHAQIRFYVNRSRSLRHQLFPRDIWQRQINRNNQRRQQQHYHLAIS